MRHIVSPGGSAHNLMPTARPTRRATSNDLEADYVDESSVVVYHPTFNYR